MLYTPVPGTPLFQQMTEEGRMLDGIDLADIHGQYKFNFQHAAISRDESKRLLDWAFRFDFERNGPSLFRICDTIFQGWKRYKNHPDARVRQRIANEAFKLRTTYDAALWAMEKRLKKTNAAVSAQDRELRREIEQRVRSGDATGAGGDRTGPAVDVKARRSATGERQDLRAADICGSPELGGIGHSLLRTQLCHHEEAFEPTRDLLFRGGSRSLASLVMTLVGWLTAYFPWRPFAADFILSPSQNVVPSASEGLAVA